MWLFTDFSFLSIVGLMDSVSPVLAYTIGLLTTWQLDSPRASDTTTEGKRGREGRKVKARQGGREGERAKRDQGQMLEMETKNFYNLISEVTSFCFCPILFTVYRSLNLAHSQGRRLHKG